MIDILERLKGYCKMYSDPDLLRDAAEEIERLRAELNDAALERAWAERNAAVAELHNYKEVSQAREAELRTELMKTEQREIEWENACAHWEEEAIASQAREAKLRDLLARSWTDVVGMGVSREIVVDALNEPQDDTALKEAIKQAKREMLLEVVDCLSPCDAGEFICDELRNWAEELK